MKIKPAVAKQPAIAQLPSWQEINLDRHTARVDLEPQTKTIALKMTVPWRQLKIAPLSREQFIDSIRGAVMLTPGDGPVAMKVEAARDGVVLSRAGLSQHTLGAWSERGSLVTTLELEGTAMDLRLHVPEVELHAHGAEGYVSFANAELGAEVKTRGLQHGLERDLAEFDEKKKQLLENDADSRASLPPAAYKDEHKYTVAELQRLEHQRAKLERSYQKALKRVPKELEMEVKYREKEREREERGEHVWRVERPPRS